jgi:hypothetical protein
LAVGRRPNGKDIAAEKAGVIVNDRGFIPVDKQQKTNVPHIYAIGDICGDPMLAHKATNEAKIAAEVIAGHKVAFDALTIPSVAYTDPEIAWMGVTETEAKAKGIPFEKASFPWAASGRALAMAREDGVTKLLWDPTTKRIIGAGIVGVNAGELLAETVLAMEMGADGPNAGFIPQHPAIIASSGKIVDPEGKLTSARAVARGTAGQVLALPGVTQRGEMLVHNHPSGWLEPSDADLNIAARLHDDGVGFGIIDNDVTDLYVVTEVPRVAQKVLVPASAIERDFGPDGPLARGFGAYETRAGQRDMASTIARTYADGGVALLEAGTGVGKSMAYLVPALRWAAANKERTVVSTNTITLQEQLVGKDLPLLADLLSDQPVRFALLKGWRNYLCLSRLTQAQAASASLFEAPQRDELAMLGEWAQSTKDGSLSDLPTPPRPDVWDEVAAEGDLCTRLKCGHFDACFVFKARRHAATADVVVVNHSLLLADIAVRRSSNAALRK